MKNKNQGLADNQEGKFILNESGTSISTDEVEGVDLPLTSANAPDSKKETEAKR